jgi:zinc protease
MSQVHARVACPTWLRCALAASALAGAALSAAAPARAQVHEDTLANGMRLLVKEDRRAPVAVSMLCYRAGSMDEVSGTTGVAHVLEHMMFKGTRAHPPGDFSRTVARAGGRDNAFTSRDATCYHQQLQVAHLPLAFELEADRMANLTLSEEEFAREIKVVMEERRLRTEDQPRALLYESLLATAYRQHPYRTPILGWMDDLENMRVEDARAWYRAWYAPNNATLVVVGDVDARQVFDLAQRWFGPIPARALPARRSYAEPPQRGARRATLAATAELPYLMMAWHVPVLRDPAQDWEPYALWVLASALDGYEAARLPRALVRESRLAVSVSAGYDAIGRGPGLFVVSGAPAPGRSADELEAAIQGALRSIAQQGIAAQELVRIQAQAIAGEVFQRDSMFAQAMQIGRAHNAGLPADSAELMLRKLEAVTADQVQAVARKYFVGDNLTVATLRPQPLAAVGR